MTKREHDQLHKANHGASILAAIHNGEISAEEVELHGSITATVLGGINRSPRRQVPQDFLTYRRATTRPGLHVLAEGSRFRTIARYRRDTGKPMLGQTNYSWTWARA